MNSLFLSVFLSRSWHLRVIASTQHCPEGSPPRMPASPSCTFLSRSLRPLYARAEAGVVGALTCDGQPWRTSWLSLHRRGGRTSSMQARRTCPSPRSAHHVSTLTTTYRCASTDTSFYGDDELEAYEALLLNASPETREESMDMPVTASSSSPQPPQHDVWDAEALVSAALALLPEDGSAARLTELSARLDAEVLSTRYGSARQFFEAFPTRFVCTRQVVPASGGKDQTRWFVRRRRASGEHTSLPHPEETTATADNDSGAAITHLQRLMAAYLEEELTALASPKTSPHLATPRQEVNTAWSTPPAAAVPVEASRRTDEQAVPVWDEAIPFDEEDDEGFDAEGDHCQSDGDPPRRPGATREGSELSTISVVYTPAAATKAVAPASRASTRPNSHRKRKGQRRRGAHDSESNEPIMQRASSEKPAFVARTPEALEAMHTALAERRGWRTPRELLDYFVECVPTFFVPVRTLVATDALARLLGPRNAMAHVVDIYSYFFEFQADEEKDGATCNTDAASAGAANAHGPRVTPAPIRSRAVRLRADLVHPRRGQADAFYHAHCLTNVPDSGHDTTSTPAESRASRLQTSAVTSCFATLQTTIPSAPRDVANATRRRSVKQTRPATSFASSPSLPHPLSSATSHTPSSSPHGADLFLRAASGDDVARQLVILCAVVPSTHFMSLEEVAAATGFEATAIHAWVHDNAYCRHHGLFLVRDVPCCAHTRCLIRLRPLRLSPSATDNYEVAELPDAVRRQLRPTWTPLARFLTKLPGPALSALQTRARAAARQASSTDASSPRVIPFGAEADYLMRYGSLCWLERRPVSAEQGTQNTGGLYSIRAFTGDPDLDDMGPHALTMLLHHYADATVWSPLAKVLEVADAGLVALLNANTEAAQKAHRAVSFTSSSISLTAMARAMTVEELFPFLKTQRLLLEVQRRPCPRDGGDTEEAIWIRRRTAFAAFS